MNETYPGLLVLTKEEVHVLRLVDKLSQIINNINTETEESIKENKEKANSIANRLLLTYGNFRTLQNLYTKLNRDFNTSDLYKKIRELLEQLQTGDLVDFKYSVNTKYGNVIKEILHPSKITVKKTIAKTIAKTIKRTITKHRRNRHTTDNVTYTRVYDNSASGKKKKRKKNEKTKKKKNKKKKQIIK